LHSRRKLTALKFRNGEWISKSTTKDQCLKKKFCLKIDPTTNLEVPNRFNEAECAACAGNWTSAFSWNEVQNFDLRFHCKQQGLWSPVSQWLDEHSESPSTVLGGFLTDYPKYGKLIENWEKARSLQLNTFISHYISTR
jgi:hypothetical protein